MWAITDWGVAQARPVPVLQMFRPSVMLFGTISVQGEGCECQDRLRNVWQKIFELMTSPDQICAQARRWMKSRRRGRREG
jgi:hypothetical protein